jgi:hypothetical protein
LKHTHRIKQATGRSIHAEEAIRNNRRTFQKSHRPAEGSDERSQIDAIAICAIICGAEGWTDMEIFGNSKAACLNTFLELPNGIPSHDTFGRVFGIIDAQQFQLAFWEWVWAVNDLVQGQIVNIDGKRLRGSDDQETWKTRDLHGQRLSSKK